MDTGLPKVSKAGMGEWGCKKAANL